MMRGRQGSTALSDQVEKENAAKIGLFAAEGKRQERGKPLHCCLSEGENELSSIRTGELEKLSSKKK